MSPSYKLGLAVGTGLRFLVAVLLIGLAPVLVFWLYLAASIACLLRRAHGAYACASCARVSASARRIPADLNG
jgi:hypothetical protein